MKVGKWVCICNYSQTFHLVTYQIGFRTGYSLDLTVSFVMAYFLIERINKRVDMDNQTHKSLSFLDPFNPLIIYNLSGKQAAFEHFRAIIMQYSEILNFQCVKDKNILQATFSSVWETCSKYIAICMHIALRIYN